MENDSAIQTAKMDALDKEKLVLEKRLYSDDNQIKNLKSDFDNLMKQTQVHKKQNVTYN